MTATKKLEKTETAMELFVKATETSKWETIDELLNAVDKVPEFWEKVLSADTDTKFRKQILRQWVRKIKTKEGYPLYASIKTTDEQGNVKQVYKQETLFDMSDYQQAAVYHGKAVVHHAQLAAHYAKGFKQLTGKQMQLPFDERAILLD